MAIFRCAEAHRERPPGGLYLVRRLLWSICSPSMIWRDARVKILPFAMLTCIAWVSACHAGERSYSPANGLLIHVDWQEPWFLPRRFRNHCSFDVTQARYYCSNHCGSDYEFYYCSKKSFGCCHIGVGYCERDGLLRCHR